MKKILAAFIITTGIVFAQSQVESEIQKHLSNLPFDTPKVFIPVFKEEKFDIRKFGAEADGIFINTQAINSAISDCNSKGGGHVIIPAGMWITGPIELKSNVDLHLEKGALVIFSEDHKNFPLSQTSSNSFDVMTPIYGKNLENIAITGEGIFDGNGQSWRPVKKMKLTESQWKELVGSGGVVSEKGDMWWPSKEAMDGEKYLASKNRKELTKDDFEKVKDFLRPYMFYLERCKNIFLDSFTLQNSPKFAMNLKNCNNIIARKLIVNNEWWHQNGDGLDLSACKNVLMYDCLVNAGDDGICMKSSGDFKDQFGMENIVIADCNVYHAHGGFVIGSNTDGGIRNISVKNCTFTWTDTGLRFKSGIGRGGKVQNIFVENIYMKEIQEEAITFDMYYSDAGAVKMKDDKIIQTKSPNFKDIFMKNIFVDGAKKMFYANGLPELPIENISLTHSFLKCKTGFELANVSNFSFSDIKILLKEGVLFSFNNSSSLSTDGITLLKPVGKFAKISGGKTKNVIFRKVNPAVKIDSIEFLNGAQQNEVSVTNE